MIASMLLCVCMCLCTVGARAHVHQHAGYGLQHWYSRQYPQTESVQAQHVHQLNMCTSKSSVHFPWTLLLNMHCSVQ